jgi:1,4-dihydroxy-2-naphthoate octaprenyltransferase
MIAKVPILTPKSVNMFTRSTLLHLRIPFSFFLMPVFLFAWALSESADWSNTILVFITLHLFLYPASNGYNSYFDKDEKSIGGLKHPPEVSRQLYRWALIFDGAAIAIGLFIGWKFAFMLAVYGLVSKAYSHPSIRLKKYAVISWVIAGFFQGAFTFWMVQIGIDNVSWEIVLTHWKPALLTSAILWGSYPMTQVYQHEEDKKRGDITLSYKLGIRGTFLFTLVMFSFASGLYWIWFYTTYSAALGWYFLVAMLPIVLYFNFWFLDVLKDESKADFDHTMRLNFLSALMLNGFFVFLYFQLH